MSREVTTLWALGDEMEFSTWYVQVLETCSGRSALATQGHNTSLYKGRASMQTHEGNTDEERSPTRVNLTVTRICTTARSEPVVF
jgi:hypothetical protein